MEILIRFSVVGIAAMGFIISAASAQEKIKVRGTIERIDGSILTLKTRYGAPVKLTITETPEFVATVKSSFEDIRPGVYVGWSGKGQIDGNDGAREIHIFPNFMREISDRLNEDVSAESTTANASVERVVAEPDRYLVTVKYKNEDKQLALSRDAPVVTFVAGQKDEIRPGVKVFIADARKVSGGMLQAQSVVYGRDGLIPPL